MKIKKILVLLIVSALAIVVAAKPTYAYVELDSDTDFSQQKIAFLGDSILNNYNVNEEESFAYLVSKELGFDSYQVDAVNGSHIATRLSEDDFLDRFQNLDNDADVVVVFGGINDYSHDTVLGLSTSTDESEFYGALNKLYSSLLIKYGYDTKIIVMTPLDSVFADGSTTDEDNSVSLKLEDYVNAMIDARIDGINVLDLNSISNIDPINSTQDRTLFYDAIEAIHPNALGHRRIADILESVLAGENLFDDTNSTYGYHSVGFGTFQESTSLKETDFIQLESGRYYVSSGTRLANSHMTYWDETYAYVDGISQDQYINISEFPETATFARLNFYEEISENDIPQIREIKNYALVDFYMDGANTITDSIKVDQVGTTISEPIEPIKTGETFLGWYTDSTYTEEFDFDNDYITDDITLYAKWSDSVASNTPGTAVPTTPTEVLSFLGVAWYWWVLGITGVYYFGFTKKGRKVIGLK